jgi:hypothetical protein
MIVVNWDHAHPEPTEAEECPHDCDEDGMVWFEVEHGSGKVFDDARPCPAGCRG